MLIANIILIYLEKAALGKEKIKHIKTIEVGFFINHIINAQPCMHENHTSLNKIIFQKEEIDHLLFYCYEVSESEQHEYLLHHSENSYKGS